MKQLNYFFWVIALFFFAACGDGVERVVPVGEDGVDRIVEPVDEDGESVSDEDVQDPPTDSSDSYADADSTDIADTSDDGSVNDSDDTGDEDPADVSDDDITDSTDDSDSGNPDADTPEPEKYCSAVFDGESSKIEVPHNDLLDLGESWTIEAWVKQDWNDLSQDTTTIIRKGGEQSVSYYLTAIRQYSTSYGPNTQEYKTIEGGFYYNNYSSFVATTSATSGLDTVLNDDWNHIALSYQTFNYGYEKQASVAVYVNGKKVAEKIDTRNLPTPNKLSDSLVIGYDAYQKTYFNGKIEQLKISTNTYENDFSNALPKPLVTDENTIAFWDFNGNADDLSGHGLNGSATDTVTYSTDCLQ